MTLADHLKTQEVATMQDLTLPEFDKNRQCRKPPRYVPYKGTYVPYDGTFGIPDQGQTLDV
jgi:hypothetical protein